LEVYRSIRSYFITDFLGYNTKKENSNTKKENSVVFSETSTHKGWKEHESVITNRNLLAT